MALGLDGVVRVEGTTQWGTAVEAPQNRDVFIDCALRHGWRANATWAGVVQDMLRDHVETAGWSIQIRRPFGEDREPTR